MCLVCVSSSAKISYFILFKLKMLFHWLEFNGTKFNVHYGIYANDIL